MSILRKTAANDNGEAIEALINALERVASSFVSDTKSFVELEDSLLTASNEFVRRSLEKWLQSCADEFGDELLINKVRYRRHQPGSARYFSLCGALEIERWTYRLANARNGPTAVPIELAAGLIYGSTPALAYAITQGHAKAPVRSVEQDLIAARRHPPSRSTMDRIGRTIGLDVQGIVEIFEPVLRAEETVPAGTTAINIGLDRTTIPMEEPLIDVNKKVVTKRAVKPLDDRPACLRALVPDEDQHHVPDRYRKLSKTRQPGRELRATAFFHPISVFGTEWVMSERSASQTPRARRSVLGDTPPHHTMGLTACCGG